MESCDEENTSMFRFSVCPRKTNMYKKIMEKIHRATLTTYTAIIYVAYNSGT